MFGDNDKTRKLAEFLLEMFSIEDILEMNEMTTEDVLVFLLEHGMFSEPSGVIEEYEVEED